MVCGRERTEMMKLEVAAIMAAAAEMATARGVGFEKPRKRTGKLGGIGDRRKHYLQRSGWRVGDVRKGKGIVDTVEFNGVSEN